ncbi:MAG: DUF5719 family protein [Actinomycetes bacterium]
MKRVWRLPLLLLLPMLIIGAVVVQGRSSNGTVSALRLNEMVPTASPDDALSSTWYCPAGTATGITTGESAGFAEQTITVANASSVDSTGVVTTYTEKGETAQKALSVGAHSQKSLRVSDIVTSPWASALVEMSGGGITVTHELRGPTGRSVSACASGPSGQWYFPSGTTRAGTRNLVALFNPFPGEATITFSFDTEDGTRTPQQLQGMVVPGGRVVIVDVGAIVTLRERVSTTVSVRIGRVIAEQIQTGDGRNSTEQGLTAVLGATTVNPIWTFPVATPASTTAREIVSVMNTGDSDTEVQVEVLLDDPATNGSVEPFVLEVPSNRAAQIDLGSDPRIPKSVGRWLIVRSTSNAPIVVERSIGTTRTAAAGGFAFTMGVPVLATSWLGTVASASELSATLVAVANPSATETATVTVSVHSKGTVNAVSSARSVRVAPGQRLLLNLSAVTSGIADASIQVESDKPIVVGQWMASATPLEFFTVSNFPVVGTESLPVNVFTPDQAVAVSVEGSSNDTIPAVSSTTVASTTTTTMIATTSSTTVAGVTTTAVR